MALVCVLFIGAIILFTKRRRRTAEVARVRGYELDGSRTTGMSVGGGGGSVMVVGSMIGKYPLASPKEMEAQRAVAELPGSMAAKI